MKKYPIITKSRREHFGGIIFRESPAFVAYINHASTDSYGIPHMEGAILKEDVFTAPLDAHLALTTRCNMYCKGCYSTLDGDAPADIPLGLAKAIIDTLASLGLLSISFGGGEPTLHPHLQEIAAYAREKNVLPNMTTNGLNINPENANDYAIFGTVHFSIHALKDMEHIFKAIRLYRKKTGKHPGLNLLLTTETLPELDNILTQARKAGIKKVLFLRYKITDKNKSIQGMEVDQQLKNLPAILKSLSWRNRQMMFLIQCSLFEELAENSTASIKTYTKNDLNGCQGGNAFIAIDIHGNFKPCSFWHEAMGSVLELNFDNWISNEKLNNFRKMRRDDGCHSCEFEELCNGGCRLLY
ncbi:MAG: radical SAM protein [Defluviitaleaceae bacterium]|nr:radical SAM protein [Defluviitaleaceae bacterium]